MKRTIEQEYYVVEKDGKVWGKEYEDGKCSVDGYIPIFGENGFEIETPLEKAEKIGRETFEKIKKEGISYITYEGDTGIEKLEKGKLKKAKVTTIIEILDI
jgi:hypothetical protein